MCDLMDDVAADLFPGATEPIPCSEGSLYRRGDLFVCAAHADRINPRIGRVEGETRCWCGGFRPIGTECGGPCDY